jgi:hypothetical protein
MDSENSKDNYSQSFNNNNNISSGLAYSQQPHGNNSASKNALTYLPLGIVSSSSGPYMASTLTSTNTGNSNQNMILEDLAA